MKTTEKATGSELISPVFSESMFGLRDILLSVKKEYKENVHNTDVEPLDETFKSFENAIRDAIFELTHLARFALISNIELDDEDWKKYKS